MRQVQLFWDFRQKLLYGISLPILASLKAVSGRIKSKFDIPLIYIYEVPTRFNYDMLTDGTHIGYQDIILAKDISQASLLNATFGPRITKEVDIYSPIPGSRYLTSQYSLEPLIHYKLLRDPRRTVIKEQASVAVLPFYPFLSGWKNHPYVFDTFHLADHYMEFFDAIQWQNSPLPHIIFYGDVMWNSRPHFPQNDKVKIPKNTYFATLEEHTGGYHSMNSSETSSELASGTAIDGQKLKHSHVITIPFPTSVHFDRKKPKMNVMDFDEKRPYLLCYAGRDRWPVGNLTIAVEAKEIQDTDFKVHKFEQKGWKTLNDEASTLLILEFYKKCTFTLHPYADMGTRRGFYDSMTVGSIPVVYTENVDRYSNIYRGKEASADVLKFAAVLGPYPEDWKHLEITSGSVQLAKAIVKDLNDITPQRLHEMRRYVFENLRSFQFSRYYDPADGLSLAIKTILDISLGE
jgi:hypothetical protein